MSAAQAPSSIKLAVQAMATRFELALHGPDPVLLRAAAEEAAFEIERLGNDLSRFRPGSLISYVNAHAATRPVALDAETFELIEACLAIHAETRGAFDPTQGPRMRRHGLWPEEVRAPVGTGGDAIELDRTRGYVAFGRPIELDLGAIAKGHAIDAAVEVLAAARVRNGLVHGGTSAVKALGRPAEREAWRIAIANPDGPPAWAVLLADGALGVSAPHGRRVATRRGTAGHVIDPRSGEPAGDVTLAAVVGPSARLCDAWSTALVVDPELHLPPRYSSLVVRAGECPERARRRGHAPELFTPLLPAADAAAT